MTVMYLYLLENVFKKILYIGLTYNLERRLEEHNKKNKHFTGRMEGTWKLIGTKKLDDVSFARKEEKRLKKSKNRKYIRWYFQKSP